MEPNYHSMQLILVDKHNHQYDRGDVILFYSENTDGILLKRIVGIPGDTIRIQNHILYINNKPYSSYDALASVSADYHSISYTGIAEDTLILDTDTYFVLGDNLPQSKDSRYSYIGCIQSQNVIGKAIPVFPHH